QEITIKSNYGGTCAGLVWLDNLNQVVGAVTKVNTGNTTITVAKPVGAVKARGASLNGVIDITFPNYGINTLKFKEIDERLQSLGVKSVNLFTRDGYTRYSDGVWVDHAEWKTTQFLSISSFVEASIFGHP